MLRIIIQDDVNEVSIQTEDEVIHIDDYVPIIHRALLGMGFHQDCVDNIFSQYETNEIPELDEEYIRKRMDQWRKFQKWCETEESNEN